MYDQSFKHFHRHGMLGAGTPLSAGGGAHGARRMLSPLLAHGLVTGASDWRTYGRHGGDGLEGAIRSAVASVISIGGAAGIGGGVLRKKEVGAGPRYRNRPCTQ